MAAVAGETQKHAYKVRLKRLGDVSEVFPARRLSGRVQRLHRDAELVKPRSARRLEESLPETFRDCPTNIISRTGREGRLEIKIELRDSVGRAA